MNPANMAPQVNSATEDPDLANSVWTYGGYRLESSNFASALAHLYRAEVTRANSWRSRLDVTTNWAVVSTGAALSFAFGQPDTHHSVILLITVLVTLFLFIEARRYRYYELWSYRIRLIETDFYGAMLIPPFRPHPDWSKKLAYSLINPQFPITWWEAIGRRLRRNYMWIYLILGIAWFAKLLYYPTGVNTINEVFERSAMGVIRGWVVIVVLLIFYVVLIFIGAYTHQLRSASGEILHRPATHIANLTTEINEGVQKPKDHPDGAP